ncbi:MAG TPA: signal recognition particle protein [Candidatus Dormibacteraeota bacterium]|nr:signal recognition particle protein [Candidatus Dormibacteraeota bacterium]HEV2475551.1 signal recognition particle protein [Candidatus Dormibacteraeota bacterium]
MFEALADRLSAALKKITGRGVLRPEDVDAALREVRLALLEADVNFKVVKEFVERVRARLTGAEISPGLTAPQTVVKAVDEELVELLGGNREGLRYASQPPTVIMLVGLQGSGKTTTALKLALLARSDGHRPLLVGLDFRRPAAIEQLKTLAERENVAFDSGEQAIGEARRLNSDVVILDTAGRLHVDAALMQELKELKSRIRVTETLLVADSMTGQEAVKVGEAFGAEVGLDGVILTKLDGDPRGGAALSLRVATGQKIRFAGTGEKPQDLEIFLADRMASRILGMGDVLTLIERAERTIDQEQAKEVEKHLRAGQLSFDDFLAQIRQVRGMGSLEGMLDMVPGGGALKGQLADANPESEMKRMEAIILSMTRQERARPDLIDGRRKRRIALGSGVQPADVNRLLKAREAMQKLAKQFGPVGRKGRPAGLPRISGYK